MFSGIIEEIGTIQNISRSGSNRIIFAIGANFVLKDVILGDSIAVNGVCLTVTNFTETSFTVDAVFKTLEITNLSNLKIGDKVNLERALKVDSRLNGHIVQGHVDGLGIITEILQFGDAIKLGIDLSKIRNSEKYVVQKGSIAVNGVSLTIAEKFDNKIIISIIPFTWENTNLKYLNIGNYVNIEFDIFGKYIFNYFNNIKSTDTAITKETLAKYGFM